MTKIPLKPQKMTKIPLNLKNDQNTLETSQTTEILLKPQNDQNTPRNLYNDESTPKT